MSTTRRKQDKPRQRAEYQKCAEVIQVPEGCDKCGCTQPVRINNTRASRIDGTIKGRVFNFVTWRHCVCPCGNHYRTRTYDLIPEDSDKMTNSQAE
jgi:hypothetical protein